MKRKIIFSGFVLLFVCVSAAQGQNTQDPAGVWKFDAPYAPEGFTSGTITVGLQEKLHTATISFPGNDYQIPGENVKFEKDSLRFSVYVEGETINILLKMESASEMTGKASYSMGDIPLTLKKEPPKKQ